MRHRSFPALTLSLAFAAVAACHCHRSTLPGNPPAETADATAAPPITDASTSNSPAVPEASPTAGAPLPAACPAGMKEVVGSYCADVEHLCIEGWADMNSPYEKWPAGAKNVTYCQKYLPGHAVCATKKADDPSHPGKKIDVVDEKPLRFCIDEFEFPNRPGELPAVLVSWRQAKNLCETQGKRLCQDDEWTLACEGPEHLPFGYGWDRDENVCNIKRRIPMPNRALFGDPNSPEAQAELRRVDGREPIGSRPACVSPFGVHDMTGNVDEWCKDVTTKGASMTHAPYVSTFKGGHMMGNVRNRCRPATREHDPDFYDFVQGFRCCAEASKSGR